MNIPTYQLAPENDCCFFFKSRDVGTYSLKINFVQWCPLINREQKKIKKIKENFHIHMTLNFGIGPKTYLNTKPDDINDSRYPPGKNSSKKPQNLKTKEKQSKERKTKSL